MDSSWDSQVRRGREPLVLSLLLGKRASGKCVVQKKAKIGGGGNMYKRCCNGQCRLHLKGGVEVTGWGVAS